MKILKYPDPRLRIVCTPVPEHWQAITPEGQSKVGDILEDMWDVLERKSGMGLAAPQIGVPHRIIVINCQGNKFELVNPELEINKRKGWFISKAEGCLSVPGLRLAVRRWCKVKVRGFDRYGNTASFGGKDLRAAVIQHEMEHLEGITLADHAGWDWAAE